MKHARKDYNERIQDSQNIIPEDEPVFLLRGQDKYASKVLEFYISLVREDRIEAEEEVGYIRKEGVAIEDIPEVVIAEELFLVEKLLVHHAKDIRLWPVKKSPDVLTAKELEGRTIENP